MNKVAGQNGGFWGVRRGGVGGTRDREREKKKMKRVNLFGGLGLEESGVEGFFSPSFGCYTYNKPFIPQANHPPQKKNHKRFGTVIY